VSPSLKNRFPFGAEFAKAFGQAADILIGVGEDHLKPAKATGEAYGH
jgi:hypothetical protein